MCQWLRVRGLSLGLEALNEGAVLPAHLGERRRHKLVATSTVCLWNLRFWTCCDCTSVTPRLLCEVTEAAGASLRAQAQDLQAARHLSHTEPQAPCARDRSSGQLVLPLLMWLEASRTDPNAIPDQIVSSAHWGTHHHSLSHTMVQSGRLVQAGAWKQCKRRHPSHAAKRRFLRS